MNKFHKQTAYAAAFMAVFLFVAWVAFGLMIRPAAAQQTNGATKEGYCKSIIEVHESLDARFADIPHVSRVLRGKSAARFVEAFNSYGKPTNIKADEVGFYAVAIHSNAIIVTFSLNKCSQSPVLMPVHVYVELMQRSNNMRESM